MFDSFGSSSKFKFEEHPVYTLIKGMLEGAHYLRAFSFTRLKQDIPDCYFAAEYVITLKELLEKENIRCKSFLYAMGQALRPDQCLDSLYIIGSEGDARKETNRLVEIVGKCPEGPLYEHVLEKMKVSEQRLNNFKQTIIDAKEDKKRLLTISHGPAYFTREHLEDVIEVFLPPIVKMKETLI